MKNVKVSIIVPVYNSEKYILDCIRSILNQSYRNIELIVINDGSTDNSENICNSISDNRMKYIYKENGGVSSARNLGLSKVTGDYVMFVDSDDCLEKNVIKDLIDNLDQDYVNSARFKIVYKTIMKKNNYKNNVYSKEEFIKEFLSSNLGGYIIGFLLDASLLNNMRFDENTGFMEDTVFLLEYLINSDYKYIRYIDNGAYYLHYQHDGSVTASKKNVLKKCKDYCYSLNRIDKLLKYEHKDKINDYKIRLMESELRLCSSLDRKNIINSIDLLKYNNNSLRFKFYSFIYTKKMYLLIEIYYFLRNILKKIYRSILYK